MTEYLLDSEKKVIGYLNKICANKDVPIYLFLKCAALSCMIVVFFSFLGLRAMIRQGDDVKAVQPNGYQGPVTCCCPRAYLGYPTVPFAY